MGKNEGFEDVDKLLNEKKENTDNLPDEFVVNLHKIMDL